MAAQLRTTTPMPPVGRTVHTPRELFLAARGAAGGFMDLTDFVKQDRSFDSAVSR